MAEDNLEAQSHLRPQRISKPIETKLQTGSTDVKNLNQASKTEVELLPSKAESSNPATRPTIPNINQESQLFMKLKNPPTQAVNSGVEVDIRKLPGNSVQ